MGTKAYVKTYNGKPHIILKGHPGLRKVLTGTKYGIKNPKVITMGLGKASAIHAAKSGGILSVVLLSVYRVADYFLTDEATLSQLIGSLAADIVKVGITAGASIAAASAIVGLGVTIAVGPIIAVVAVGVVMNMALGEIDEYYGITDRVIAGIDNFNEGFQAHIQTTKNNLIDKANEAAASVIDYVVDSARVIVIDTAKHQLRKLLSSRPRFF